MGEQSPAFFGRGVAAAACASGKQGHVNLGGSSRLYAVCQGHLWQLRSLLGGSVRQRGAAGTNTADKRPKKSPVPMAMKIDQN